MDLNSNASKVVLALTFLILLLISGVLGFNYGEHRAMARKDEEFAQVLEGLREEHKQVVTVKNSQVASLQEALSGKDAEIGLQADLILKLKEKPAQVKYLTRVETVLVPAEPQIVSVPSEDLPMKHLFSLTVPDGELVVARFEKVKDKVEFQTYEQKWVLNAVLGETSSSFLLRGSTSFEEGVMHEVPVTVKVTRVTDHPPRVLKAALAMGITGSVGTPFSGSDLHIGEGGSVTLPWLHPLPVLDVLVPRVTFGATHSLSQNTDQFVVRGGLDAVSYNFGEPAPLVDDLWLGVGASVGTDLSWSIDLGITTRL